MGETLTALYLSLAYPPSCLFVCLSGDCPFQVVNKLSIIILTITTASITITIIIILITITITITNTSTESRLTLISNNQCKKVSNNLIYFLFLNYIIYYVSFVISVYIISLILFFYSFLFFFYLPFQDKPIRVTASAKYSRIVKTTRRLQKGDVIWTELPEMVEQTMTSQRLTACGHCARSLVQANDVFTEERPPSADMRKALKKYWPKKAVVACKTCSQVKYCSDTCRDDNWEK